MLNVPHSWRKALNIELQQPYIGQLAQFVSNQRQEHVVFPPAEDVFGALKAVSPDEVRAVILGQDPYHGEGQAHGLSFSVQQGVKPPPSLKNIFKELHSDVGCEIPDHGCLEGWARQGVLLLNTVLTVRSGEANSHRKQGWEQLTDQIIRTVSKQNRPVAFILWGRPAQKKRELIEADHHLIVESVHPSPLSAHNGFFGSKPFSRVNEFLQQNDLTPINWCL